MVAFLLKPGSMDASESTINVYLLMYEGSNEEQEAISIASPTRS